MSNQIETPRLVLRPVTEEDEEDVFEYSKSEQVGPNAGWKPHANKAETREVMRAFFLDKENVFGIVLKETGKVIGTIGLVPDPKRENDQARSVGYAIGEAYWGKGLMTEAAQALIRYGFETLRVGVISAYCYPYNDRSKRVIEKCGLKKEGTLSLCEKRYDGVILDNECYALDAASYFTKSQS